MPIVAEPLGVATDLEVVGEQDVADLLDVGRGVAVDLFLGEARPCGRLPRRVADLRGEVADDEHRDVAQLLELAELAEHDREPEVDVGGGGVDPELGPQRAAGRELAPEVGLGDEVDRAGAEDAELFVDADGHDGGTLPGNSPRAPADMRIAGDAVAPLEVVAAARATRPMRVVTSGSAGGGTPSSTMRSAPRAGEVGAVVRAGDPERLAQLAGPDRRSRSRRAFTRRVRMTLDPTHGRRGAQQHRAPLDPLASRRRWRTSASRR